MVSLELDAEFVTACTDLGLDPNMTDMLTLECARQGRDPANVNRCDLDADASELWTRVRRLRRAA